MRARGSSFFSPALAVERWAAIVRAWTALGTPRLLPISGLRTAASMDDRSLDAYRTEDALDRLRNRDDFRLLMMELAMPAEPLAPWSVRRFRPGSVRLGPSDPRTSRRAIGG